MGRAAHATLSTEHLIHNWQVLRKAAPSSRIWAMVKANAYGHGIRSVSQRLAPHLRPHDALGVASVDEALILRQAGVQSNIVLIEGVFEPQELAIASAQNFTVVFHCQRQIEWLKQSTLEGPIEAWVKVNTGMGRLGLAAHEGVEAWKQVASSRSIKGQVGVMSHLACADHRNDPHNEVQLKAFDAFRSLEAPLSICNSAGVFHWPSYHADVVRPGLALYGASPMLNVSAKDLNLKPVMSLRTNLIALHPFKKGDGVGYGSAFVCPEDMLVGIAAMGYGDGYPRLAAGAPVIIQGVECSVVGRVSMDMMAIDLRPCYMHGKRIAEGDAVMLWGQSELGDLPVERVALSTQRIPYDLLTSVQHRVKFAWV